MPTDYDCWHPHHDEVSVETVIAVLRRNVATAKAIVHAAVPRIASHDGPAPMSDALRNAIMTAPEYIPEAKKRALAPLVRKYLE